MKPQNLDLSLVSTTEPDWFHLLDEASEAIRFKLKSLGGSKGETVWEVFERTDIGFCYKGQCMGAKPSEAFNDYVKKNNALFTVNMKVIF